MRRKSEKLEEMDNKSTYLYVTVNNGIYGWLDGQLERQRDGQLDGQLDGQPLTLHGQVEVDAVLACLAGRQTAVDSRIADSSSVDP